MVKVARHREEGGRTGRRVALFGTVALLMTAVGPAYGLGLGRLELRSSLDESLVAEIPVQQVADQERPSLKASLGSREQFEKADIPRPQHLTLMQFNIESGASGDVLRITTEFPVREPFLHFLVQLEWSGGRLVKEYTALLDPPLYEKGKAPQVSAAPTIPLEPQPVTETPSEAAPMAAATTAPQAPATANLLGPPEVSQGHSVVYDVGPDTESVAADAEPQLAGPAPAQIGPTKQGDSLWGYATQLKESLGASEFQVMLSLLRENPDAFTDGNINRLKVGQVLKVPAAETVQAISPKEASAVYVEQYDAWQHFKMKLAEQATPVEQPEPPAAPEPDAAPAPDPAAPEASAPAGQPDPEKPAETGPTEPAAPAPDAAATAPAQADANARSADTQAQLKIVQAGAESGDPAAAGTGASQAADEKEKAGLRNKITTLEEAVISGETENRELRERLKILEEQVANAQRLIELQDKDLALAQQQASMADKSQVEPAQAVPADPVAGQVAGQPETVADAAVTASEAADQAGIVQPAPMEPVAEPEPLTPAEPLVKVQPEASQAPEKPAPPARERIVADSGSGVMGMVNEFTRNLPRDWPMLAGAAGAVIIVGVVGLWIYRRRRSIAEFEESILSGSALDSRTHTTPSEQIPSGTDTSFLSDFGVPGMGSMHADEVDPLAEAEVYLAYGRSEQAEEVLREAANKNPQRHEIKLKLLEIYEQRKDLKAFETLAEEMYPAQGAEGDPVWSRVVEMGRRMNPANPLFKGVPAVAAAAATGAAAASAAAAKSAELEPFPSPDESDEGMDLDLDDILGSDDRRDDGGLDLEDTVGDQDDLAATLKTSAAAPVDEMDLAGTVQMKKSDLPGIEDIDLDLGTAQPEPPAAETLELDQDDLSGGELEFESTSDDLQVSGEQDLEWESPASPGAGDADHEVEFDLGDSGAESGEDVAEAALEEISAAPGSGNGNGGDDDGMGQWDETATKLDLAKAYIDMGDESGARSILDEVIAEGNDKQKQQASELAAQLGA